MKKILVGLLLVASSVLSFGAQRVPYEKLSFPGGYISYNDEKFTGEFERKDPRTGKINMVGSVKNGELHGTSYSYDEKGKLIGTITFENDQIMEETTYKDGKIIDRKVYPLGKDLEYELLK